MLVAISGSQGCGKTTVLSRLAELGYTTIERKTSRSILSDWGVTLAEVNNNHDLTIKFQEEIINRKLRDENVSHLSSQEVCFTERTYADLFTYALVTLGKENAYSDWLTHYYNRCMSHQQQYDLVFYIKAGHFGINHDGVRGSSIHYSRAVDLIMLDVTSQMTASPHINVIDTPDLQHRIQMITHLSSGYMKKHIIY